MREATRAAAAVNLISHYTPRLIAVIGSSISPLPPERAPPSSRLPSPPLHCRRRHPRPHTAIRCCAECFVITAGKNPLTSPARRYPSACTSVCACARASPLYLPIHNARNCNFSFHCGGIIKWQECLMQAKCKLRGGVHVRMPNGLFFFLPGAVLCDCPHGSHSC